MKYLNIREEELKNKVAEKYFAKFDSTKIIGNIDFCITEKGEEEYLFDIESFLWAEAKRGKVDIYKAIVQLILTIGKAKTFNEYLPPKYLSAFDGEKIVFLPYGEIQEIFYLNDFNWNITPSNHETKEFHLVYEKTKSIINKNSLLFFFQKDDKELQNFIKENFVILKNGTNKIQIDKNNFINVYNRWLDIVKPTIKIDNWELLKSTGIITADFYLADLLSLQNNTKEISEKLFTLLLHDHYLLDRDIQDGLNTFKEAYFNDNQKAHNEFWNKYQRPPPKEYWDYLIERRDLLVPQDIRERKGSFYTPKIWVEKSQEYLADVLGENWQDEYTIWDCAAGTGNLLAGLTNKYNAWASTLDRADVDVMKERIRNGANLLENHVFQFDFLNDDFSKLPEGLKNIIKDEEKRKKLLIYINPPYTETNNKSGRDRSGVSDTKIAKEYKEILQKAKNEIFTQFLIRIYKELPNCKIGEFSKLKLLQAPNFQYLQNTFLAKLEKMFIAPANTFDNVKGQFPIGFKIWDTAIQKPFKKIKAEVFDKNQIYLGKKNIYNLSGVKYINKWIKKFKTEVKNFIGYLYYTSNDFQQQNTVSISSFFYPNNHLTNFLITENNLIVAGIYFSVRKCISPTWSNDRDQFLFPDNKWETDKEFQSDCLAYTLFHGSNNIVTNEDKENKEKYNHWIPFTEQEVNAKEKFGSSFMTDFIAGKTNLLPEKEEKEKQTTMIKKKKEEKKDPLTFSAEAKEVFDAGRELWKYYHEVSYLENSYNANASFYEIREYFQGRNQKTGKMNHKSNDEKYTKLIAKLRGKIKILGNKIIPKVYDHGFLKR